MTTHCLRKKHKYLFKKRHVVAFFVLAQLFRDPLWYHGVVILVLWQGGSVDKVA
jgi:hypothetical protein